MTSTPQVKFREYSQTREKDRSAGIGKVRTCHSWLTSPFGSSPIHSWKLERSEPAERIYRNCLVIQGWLLLHEQPTPSAVPPELVIKLDRHTELVYPIAIPRPDAIATVFGSDPSKHPQLRCGFRFCLPASAMNQGLYCRFAGRLYPLARPRPRSNPEPKHFVPKVLEGKDGWLFLHNDTNYSIDQHQGRLKFTRRGLVAWQEYARQFKRIGSQHQALATLLAAPTKESLLGQFHPLPAASPSPIEQLEMLLGDELLLHPTNSLRALGTEAFSRNDTHWSDKAACAVALGLAERLKVSSAILTTLFKQDTYIQTPTCGDLGDKLQPPRAACISILDPKLHSNYLVYDNGLRGTGRLMATECPHAPLQATLLLLGSSSSYALIKFACRIFSRVIFAHTAAALDPGLISSVKPAQIIASTNARYVIQVPAVRHNLLRTMRTKLRRMNSEARASVLANRIAASPETLHRLGIAAYDLVFCRYHKHTIGLGGQIRAQRGGHAADDSAIDL